MEELPNESGSDDEFDGYLGPEDGPCVFQGDCVVDDSASGQVSRLADTTGEPTAHMESPLVTLSPSPAPMEGHYSSGSPLSSDTDGSPRGSPTLSPTAPSAAAGSSSAPPPKVNILYKYIVFAVMVQKFLCI